MTVSSIVVRAVAGWTGTETEFPTGIQLLEKDQLAVSLLPDEGERQMLTRGLHYAVTLSPAGVATVAPLAAFPAIAGEVSFVRRTPMTQDYDPSATDSYDAAGHAAALDRSAMRVAELSQAVDDIEAASVVVKGGASSVPEGAVYVSDGAGKAIAGPTVTEIKNAEDMAEAAKGAAKAAADSAAAAALFDPSSYSTTAQITALLAGYALATLVVAGGPGVLLNGDASATLGATITVSLDYATTADMIAGLITGKPADPAGVKAAIQALAPKSGFTGVFKANVSGSWTVPDGITEIVIYGWGGGGAGGWYYNWTYSGGRGGVGGFFVHSVAVTPGQVIPFTIGAGGAATSSYEAGINGAGGGATSIPSLGVSAGGGGGGGGASGSANGTPGVNGLGTGGNVLNTDAFGSLTPRQALRLSRQNWGVSELFATLRASETIAVGLPNGAATTYRPSVNTIGTNNAIPADLSASAVLNAGTAGQGSTNATIVPAGGVGGAILIVY